jgi:hypothetical protein
VAQTIEIMVILTWHFKSPVGVHRLVSFMHFVDSQGKAAKV